MPKKILAVSWIGLVVFFYFKNHWYYTPGIIQILYLSIPVLIYAAFFFLKKIRITLPRILTAALIGILILGNIMFLVTDPSYNTGGDIIYSYNPETLAIEIQEVHDYSEIPEGADSIVVHNSSMQKTKDTFKWLPAEFHKNFITPKIADIQKGLITKTIGLFLIMFFLTLTAVSTGFSILKLLLKKAKLNPENALISLGLGLFAIILTCFFLGKFGILNQATSWATFILLSAISYKSVLQILKKLKDFKQELKINPKSLILPILIILGLTVLLNFIDGISPTPRGYDGLNRYVNLAKEIFEAGGLIRMGGNYYWELFMSLGFTMFNWTTATLFLASFFPAAIALAAIYIVSRKFLSKKYSLIAAASIYATPLFTFHIIEDNKVDLASFAISTISFLSLYLGITSKDKKEQSVYIIIAGLLAGFAFGIKITAMILIFAMITILLNKYYKTKGTAAGILFGLGTLAITNNINMGHNFSAPQITGVILVVIAAILLLISIIKEKNFHGLKTIVIFALFAGMAFSPWAIGNFMDTGSLSTRALILGENPQPKMDYDAFEGDLAINHEECKGTGTIEELDRYLGYDHPAKRILTLPWHLTMNDQGVYGKYVDIGWIFLALIPALLLFVRKKSKKWMPVIVFGVSYWIFWLVSGNGIIWYGLPGLLPLAMYVSGLLDNLEKTHKKYGKIFAAILVLILIIPFFTLRIASSGKHPLLLYISDTITEEETVSSIYPNALAASDIFEKNDGLIWRVGTTLPYFIENSFSRTFNDQYLDDFHCLYLEKDMDLLERRLQAGGFKYMIFDYNTYSISSDLEGTMAEKYMEAFDYIFNHSKILVYDIYKGDFVVEIGGS
ncbi:MAG: glycosyltransferase family 39 protein [Patescibacteria group bacterium]|nr:glycosyltransferase family 39 protein [Patescibacteria group bacterium]